MKKSILMAALGLLSLNTIAQDTTKEEGFIFTTVKENPITSVKNQNRAIHRIRTAPYGQGRVRPF